MSTVLGRVVCLFPFSCLSSPSRRRAGVVRAASRPFSQWRPSMGKKLYVGNLAYTVTDSMLEELFAPHGAVQSAQIIMDRDTGRSKGFGFVEMGNDQEAQNAIKEMNLKQVEGRALTVNEA